MPTVKAKPAASTKTRTKSRSSSNARTKARNTATALVCAEGGECFWLNDGRILSNLLELRDALDAMSDEVFMHHVTDERNDFADWVEYVLRDPACAAALRATRDRDGARRVTVTHLRRYSV